jgi:hypothetical protein
MRTIGVAALLAAAAGCAGPAPEPPTAAAGEVPVPAVFEPLPPVAVPEGVPPELAKVFEERNRRHKRVAGARLTITAKWVHDPGLEPGVRVEWAIDYAGPRRPFTIATPGRWTDPAVAHFWYVGPDGTAAAFTYGLGGDRLWP